MRTRWPTTGVSERWMIPVTVGRGRKVHDIDADHGIRPTTLEGLAALEPVQPDGVVSYGSQTHPADGTAGMVITTAKQARRPRGRRALWAGARLRVRPRRRRDDQPVRLHSDLRSPARFHGCARNRRTASCARLTRRRTRAVRRLRRRGTYRAARLMTDAPRGRGGLSIEDLPDYTVQAKRSRRTRPLLSSSEPEADSHARPDSASVRQTKAGSDSHQSGPGTPAVRRATPEQPWWSKSRGDRAARGASASRPRLQTPAVRAA